MFAMPAYRFATNMVLHGHRTAFRVSSEGPFRVYGSVTREKELQRRVKSPVGKDIR